MEANYLLDTNICISILKNKYDTRRRVAKVGLDHCFISEITLAELYYGASKSGDNYIMVTDNIKHLGRIPNIQITNWR